MPGGIHPPLSVVLQWPKANYDDPVTRNGLIPVIVIFTLLSILVTSARLTVRGLHQRQMGIDDWIILAAMVPTIALSVGVCLATVPVHFDRHLWDVPPVDYVKQRRVSFANELLYVIASSLVKISILFFYPRLSSATLTRTYIRIIWAAIISVIFYAIIFTFVIIFTCNPVHAFWDQVSIPWLIRPDNYPHTCTDEGAYLIVASVISVIQDFIAALVPTWLFWSIKIPPRQKIALGVVILIGFVTCALGGLRIWYIHKVFYESYDASWNAYPLWIATSVEVLIGTMCASAPPLKIFFRRLLQVRRDGTSFFAAQHTAGTNEEDDEYGNEPPRAPIPPARRRSFPLAQHFRRSRQLAGPGPQAGFDDRRQLTNNTTTPSSGDYSEFGYDKDVARVMYFQSQARPLQEPAAQSSWLNGRKGPESSNTSTIGR